MVLVRVSSFQRKKINGLHVSDYVAADSLHQELFRIWLVTAIIAPRPLWLNWAPQDSAINAAAHADVFGNSAYTANCDTFTEKLKLCIA